jgi:hypothetical protein
MHGFGIEARSGDIPVDYNRNSIASLSIICEDILRIVADLQFAKKSEIITMESNVELVS